MKTLITTTTRYTNFAGHDGGTCFRSEVCRNGVSIAYAWSTDARQSRRAAIMGARANLAAMRASLRKCKPHPRICQACIGPRPRGTGCTNNLCEACHRRFCTPGGSTSPGHGINLLHARAVIKNEHIK